MLILSVSACQPAALTNKQLKQQAQKCGDGVCSGPENVDNCPEDCNEEDKPVNETEPPVGEAGLIYLGIMVHLEGFRGELFNEEMFNHHA